MEKNWLKESCQTNSSHIWLVVMVANWLVLKYVRILVVPLQQVQAEMTSDQKTFGQALYSPSTSFTNLQ